MKSSLCLSAVDDVYNYETLEVVGDSALKYITTASIYLFFQQATESNMTNFRTEVIKNAYLKRLSLINGIH